MILTQLSDYLRRNGRASVADLARALDTTPDAVRAMLATLARKGRVRTLAGGGCGGCGKCAAADLEVYEWTAG